MPGTPATQKTFPLSWDRLHRDSLAWRLIARELEVGLIDPVGIAGYDDRDRGAMRRFRFGEMDTSAAQIEEGRCPAAEPARRGPRPAHGGATGRGGS